MSECSHDCGSCGENCAQRDMHKAPHELSKIKKVIGVVSGKGGVGKSLTTAMLAVLAERNGFDTVYVSMTDQNPLMPEARRDRGQASVMAGGIRLFPALVLVRRGDKDPRQARLVATGVVDVAEISRRVVRLASQAEAIDMARIHSAQGFAQREDVFPAFNGAPAYAGSELYEELASGLDEAEARLQEKGSQGAH